MSVSFPVIDYLELSTKSIYLLAGVREYHPVEDIYTEIRNRRRVDESMRVFDIPVEAQGNIAKGGGKYTPRYAIFNDGWQIVPENVDHSLYISGEQITNDGQSGPACINTGVLTSKVIIQYEPPSAEIVRDEISLAAIEFMAFGNRITVDTVNGISGVNNPAGNTQYPSNNNIDAVYISVNRKIKHLHFIGNNTITAPLDLDGYEISGISPVVTAIHIESAVLLSNSYIHNVKLSGDLDGGTAILDCVVDGINYFNGSIRDSGITGIPIVLGGAHTAVFNNCKSLVPGGNARPQVNFNHDVTNLAVRGWEGGLELINKTKVQGEVSIDLNSGIVYVRSSCTEGTITIRGVGKVVDESGTNCNVIHDNLLSPESAAEAVWLVSDAQKLLNENLRKAVISSDEKTVTVFEADGTTISHQYNISDSKLIRTPI